MLTEESRVAPDNPYAASKAMAELLTVQYRRITDGGIVTARPFNHTGPGQTTNFVLPAIAKQFAEIELGVRPPRLEMGNVGVQRDFTHVRDVVRAYRILLERGRVGEAYNVCSGKPVDLAEVIKVFEDVTGLKVTIETQSSKVRPNETKRVCGNPKKIRDETGWSAQIPLRKTIEDLTHAFTQGLLFHNGLLYESAGLYGQSSLRCVDPANGSVIKNIPVPDVFAEGLALWDSTLVQLTWKEKAAIRYALVDFKMTGSFSYDGEGWGLTTDAHSFIIFGRAMGPSLLMMTAGPATVAPLALFAWTARRLPFSTFGFLQFISPTIGFLVGLANGERLDTLGVISFLFIWAGAAVFVFGAWRASRQLQSEA